MSNSNFGGSIADKRAQAQRIVGEGIQKLYSSNPAERLKGIEMITSHEAFFAKSSAYEPALKVYPDEIVPDVKIALLVLIADLAPPSDQRAFKLFSEELDNADIKIVATALGALARFKEMNKANLEKFRSIYENPMMPRSIKRGLMGVIANMGKAAEPVLDIITGELASDSWLMRRATKKAIKKLKKKGVNVVGFLVKQLEEGDINKKISACKGLGIMGKDAAGSVSALAKALSDPIPEVRLNAAWALSKMGKKAAPAESILKSALNDDSPGVKKFALKTLKNMKKLSKEQKQEIKEMEEIEKEMKAWRKKFVSMYPDPPKEKEDNENALNISTKPEEQYTNYFFLSHALPDFNWVQKVMNEIESWPGCKCWTCERDIPTGGDWLESIYDGLDAANWYLLFWSDNAEKSKWTNEEIREAKTRNVSRNNPKISVVNLGKNDWPRLLQRYQGAMVTNEEELKTYLKNLRSQVGV
ncbi:MAG: TIR domain-containing protein [Promethearchaeota archaeon]